MSKDLTTDPKTLQLTPALMDQVVRPALQRMMPDPQIKGYGHVIRKADKEKKANASS